MRAMRWLLFALAVTGCATAGTSELEPIVGTDGGVVSRPDGGGNTFVPDAAPLPDAPVGQQTATLQQTNDLTVTPSEVGCQRRDPFFNFVIATRENSWYRVFKLSDHGINGPFSLQRVTFLTDWALAGTGTTQPATIKVGTYAGALDADTLDLAMITPLTSANITIPNADATQAQPAPVVTDITAMVPAGANLIVEVAAPDGLANENIFFLGTSNGGEAKRGYIRSPHCSNITTPRAITLVSANKSALISVTGTH
jgi:hypothetical protein